MLETFMKENKQKKFFYKNFITDLSYGHVKLPSAGIRFRNMF